MQDIREDKRFQKLVALFGGVPLVSISSFSIY